MKVTQDEVVDRQAVLNIEVDTELFEEHLDRAYRRLVGRIDVSGFRRGKAPRSVFERAYGRERLVEDALETMVPAVVKQAVEESDLEAGGPPRVSVLESDPTPRIKATVPLTPIVTLGDYRSLKFDDPPEEVTDEQVDAALERMRQAQATWDPVERPVQLDDMAVLSSVEGTASAKSILSANGVEYVVTADATYPVPGFATELVGLAPGDSKEFSLILPDDFPDPDVAGETATFTVAVFEVKEKRVPDLDDELAKGVGEGFETLKQLRTWVQDDLKAQVREFHKRRLQDKAIEAIIEGSTIEVPPLTVEHEAQHIIEEQQLALQRNQISVQNFLAGTGKSGDEFVEEARDAALERLKRTLVIEQLGDAEKIEVSDDEVTEETEKLRRLATSPAERASYDEDRARETVSALLKRRMTLDRVFELVHPVVEGPAKKAAAPAKSPKRGTRRTKRASGTKPARSRSRSVKSGSGTGTRSRASASAGSRARS